MPIEFRCRGCSRLLRTGDGTAGQTARCPDCGVLTVIPAPGASAPPSGAGGRGSVSGEPAWHLPPPPPPGPAPDPFSPGPDAAGEPNPYQAPTQYGTPGYALPPRRDGRATASLVLGLVGLLTLCCCAPAGIATGIVGLVFGVQTAQSEDRGMAVAGIVLNSIVLLISVASMLVSIAMIAAG